MEIPGYKIEKELGSGGMSTVYLATQLSFGRKVALKIMAPSFVANKEAATRFIREARIIAGLSHPHIVPVYDVGTHGDYHYMSMDFLTGGDLVQWLKRGLEIEEVLQITEAIASALQFAHSKGYIHRDIKPNNILFREDHSPVLTDFGISRLLNADDQVTQSGTIVGTPRYMSPEALQGKPIDGRSDLYSLGVVFYEMLARQAPYQAEDYLALALKHVNDPLPVLPPQYAKYQPFLNRLMAKQPQDRFQTGLEVVKALRALRSGQAMAAPETVEPERNKRQPEPEKAVDNHGARVGDYAITEARDGPPPAMLAAHTPPKPISVHDRLTRKSEQIARIKENTTFADEAIGFGLFGKKFRFTAEIVIYTAGNFAMIFSTFSARLKDWHDLHGRSSAGVLLRVTTFPTVFPKVRDMVHGLYHSGDAFDFLKKCEFTVELIDIDTGAVLIIDPARPDESVQ